MMDRLDRKLEELSKRLDRLDAEIEKTTNVVRDSKTTEELLVGLKQLDDDWKLIMGY